MEILKVIITSIVSIVVLFLLTKLVGNKQLSELNMFDYIVSITIGSIAAEMSTELENPEQPLVAMVVYGVISFIVSICCSKSLTVRRLIFGHSVVLMQNGKLYRENFKKCRLDLNEFLMQCRLDGYYDLSAIDTAVMEASGKIMDKNLQSAGKDKNWLNNELKVQGYKKVDDIFIAVLDSSGTLNVFTVGEGKQKNDIYE